MAVHLAKHFHVLACDHQDRSVEAKQIGVEFTTNDQVVQADILVFCIPVQYLESTLLEVSHQIKSKLVLDVSSVKVKPITLLKKHLSEEVEIIGLHPLFGPQSGKEGIEGLNCVVCNENSSSIECVKEFLKDELKVNVLLKTAEDHDKQMAYVQALTHFIGRAVNNMDIPEVDQKTNAYQNLIDIKNNLGQDSWDLFKTIEDENPYAESVRKHFLDELDKLNSQLN